MKIEQREILAQIISDCGYFFEHNHPIVYDASLLPYPKDVLYSTLEWKERELCDFANSFMREHNSKAPDELERPLNAVQSIKVLLALFADIDLEDKERVDYFNTFKTLADVPQYDYPECFALRIKYSAKGQEDLQRPR